MFDDDNKDRAFETRDETEAPQIEREAAQADLSDAGAQEAAGEATQDEPSGAASEIDQVRDILFGAAQRATDERLRALEEAVDSLRADMMRLFADLEGRMADGDAAAERRHVMATQGIGSALSEIGSQILKLSGRAGA